jgi:hypothetical protein
VPAAAAGQWAGRPAAVQPLVARRPVVQQPVVRQPVVSEAGAWQVAVPPVVVCLAAERPGV